MIGSKTATLLPCPFCGGEYIRCQWNYMGDGFKYREIHCNECGAALTKYSAYIEDDYELYELWNTRTPETCHIVTTWKDSDYLRDVNYRCSECGGAIWVDERNPDDYFEVISHANYCGNCGRKVVQDE